MKAILLARVSTEEQDTKGQLIKLKEYADSKELVYSDEDIYDFSESAYKLNRRIFNEIIQKLENHQEKVALCCDKIDRLVRRFTIFLPTLEKLRINEKIELHFPSDNIVLTSNSSANDLFRFNIGVALAQYYSDSISDNVHRSIHKRIKNGEILSNAPFGYRNVTISDREKNVEIDPFEAGIVKKLFEYYASGAFSLNELKEKINAEYNIKLGKSTIADILNNKFYHGIATYKKKGQEYRHRYETIITEELFNLTQVIKSGKNPFFGKNSKYKGKNFYYRGLIKCEECGYSLSPEQQRGKNYYCCTEYGGKHGAKYVNEYILTDKFAEAFKRISISEETAQKILSDLKKSNETNLKLSQNLYVKLRKDKDKFRNRKSKLYDSYFDNSITRDIYEEKLKEYDTELAIIEDKLSSVNKVDKDFYITAKYIVELAKQSDELFKRSEYEERKLLINTMLTNITWDGENLSYDYLEPFNLLVEMNESTLWGG